MLTNNLGLKLLSIIAAVMLWLIIVSIDDPVIYQDFSGIRVTMLNEDTVTHKDKVYRIEDNSDIISIRVQAKRSVVEKLSAEDFTATADMEKNIKLDNLVGIEVTCNSRKVRTSDILNITKSRENVVIRIEDASSEQFNVVVNETGQEGEGYMVGTAVPEQSLIQISGPASVIEEIRRVEVDLNKTGFTTDQIKNCEIKIYDNANNPIDTTYLEYNGKTTGMNVHVTMYKKKIVRIRVDYTGTPEQGYSFKELTFKPETLEIAGTTEDIADLREITIPGEAVNIDGITEDTQINVDVTKYLPENIRLADEKDASVAVEITLEKKQGKTVRIPVEDIELENVPRGLEVDFDKLKEVEIIVMGTSAELTELDENEVSVSMNLEGYSRAGTYTKALDVEVPDVYSLMQETQVEFRLVKRTSTGSNR
ncbi:CdaR family protein [Candidatus Merdisoma sp. JLR.KK006]|uniref:CdaR family protein n=1 Tax=Candidatus Merdisoma sp. JLR.KK006 TaxID=3112626 RepID=UPI002FF23DF6